MTDTVIEFISRECKTGQHQNCCSKWQGLGFEISCGCMCGHKKNYCSLDSVKGSTTHIQTKQIITAEGRLATCTHSVYGGD